MEPRIDDILQIAIRPLRASDCGFLNVNFGRSKGNAIDALHSRFPA